MNTNDLRKYFIMGSQDCPEGTDPVTLLKKALQAGITAFQFREKGPFALKGQEKITLGKKLRSLCYEYKIPFFINDDVDLIKPLRVDGIHVGQEDASPIDIRREYPELLIGLSISTEAELENSPLNVINYIGAGPMFPTTSKTDAKAVVGPEWIRILRQRHPTIPIVGIGGIQETNAEKVMKAGAHGVAVISAITRSKDIDRTVSLL